MDLRTRRTQDGFSLIEVCIAAGLLATALVNLAVLFTIAIDANLAARHRTYATVLAQQKLEQLRTEPAGAAVPIAGLEILDRSGRPLDAAGPSDAAYARRWWIERLPAGPADLLLLQVEVRRHPGGERAADGASLATLARWRHP